MTQKMTQEEASALLGQGAEGGILAFIDQAIEAGANIEKKIEASTPEPNGTKIKLTPLMLAIRYDQPGSLKKLISCGADIEHASWGSTPLIYAINCHDINLCRILLDAGANTQADGGFKTPMRIAYDRGKFDHIRLLLRYGASTENDRVFIETLNGLDRNAQEVFTPGKPPTRNMCFKDGFVSDAVLDACATLQFGTLVGAPLLAAKTEEARQLFQDIWQRLPDCWQAENAFIYTQFKRQTQKNMGIVD